MNVYMCRCLWETVVDCRWNPTLCQKSLKLEELADLLQDKKILDILLPRLTLLLTPLI